MILLERKGAVVREEHTRAGGSSSWIRSTEKRPSNSTSHAPGLYKSMRISIQPLSCGFNPLNLAAVESVTLLMEVGLYAFLLKLMELLAILMAQQELWQRRERRVYYRTHAVTDS